MTEYRIEKDSLGELEVPAQAYWGVQTQRAIQNFPITGLKPYPAFVWAMAVIKRAAAEVNADLNLFADREVEGKVVSGDAMAQAIMMAADEVIDGRLADQFVVDPIQAGAGTSHNMNVNEVIANRANEILGYGLHVKPKPISSNDHVNMAQSTNDTIPTAIRLGCLWRLDELVETLDKLAAAFRQKSAEFDDIVKSGRTHLQDAVPVRLGQEFGAYARAVERNREKIVQAADGLRRLGIGGTATGTGLNAHPEYHHRMILVLSRLTGLTLHESDDLFESMQSMADPVHFSGALRTLAQDLTRIANDFRLLSSGPSTGLDEIRLPAVQPGSSIMPGKVNPVLAEMLNMAMFQVMGNDLTVMMAGQAGQLELNVMMPIIAYNLFQSMDVIINAVNAFTDKCVVGLKANPEKATGWLAKNAILVTALNPVIGYLKGAEVAKEAMATNRTVREVVVEKGYLSAEEVDRLLNVRNLTDGGIQK
ncbi:MAG: aspartate ammonia-lyase [Chloroflexi bacterium]|nr:aspartate ammonia-lyase [Ardenticatenaceae bacterium]MBL1129760.1 aspartate ammonia-lyase [Chloroflexota bacterium]NOG35844.1 aspartate ammonia-lyase [Chloroflexota bacterium]GIK55464.1 MAG: aspartate ammonia-lyase [Chloroflexota bacterium]